MLNWVLITCSYGLLFTITILLMSAESAERVPLVLNTWAFINATEKAWTAVFKERRSAVDAVELGCTECEKEQCDGTVGYGGSPDENGETTLDAMIMDGPSHNVGAVAALRRIKGAIAVARQVLERTEHSLLVGDQATEFAKQMGFKEETLTTNTSLDMWKKWKNNNCQPNFWKNVKPDPKVSCGPYKSLYEKVGTNSKVSTSQFGPNNHDTVGMVVIDNEGRMSVGTSSNGAKHKIPGRVGDSPIPGSGAYVDQDVGGAAATGDGDIMMRFLPSYQAVENLRQGMTPSVAATDAIYRIVKKYSDFSGGIVVANIKGDYGAACHGMKEFPFSVCNPVIGKVKVNYAQCINI
ncbi:N(4)-(Beta-N-acetylglucosaminyl)-L-asparaginase [Tachypleus tridentatus]|uniref:N(4)-(Beta-N-acetylglucosaminyl)-L-asparaginase n=1 Tax=Tachypleus tridentatus TaxID=6853 RepID=UPI003FD187AB